MGLTDLIPTPYKLLGAGVLALAVAAGIGYYGHTRYEAGITAGQVKVQAAWNAEKAAQLTVAANAEASAQAETQRRAAAQLEISHVAQISQAHAVSDAVAAARAGVSVQQRFASLAAGACRGAPASNTAAAPSSPAASAPDAVLADVFGRVVSAAQQYAATADAARIAGSACEQSYDALNKGAP